MNPRHKALAGDALSRRGHLRHRDEPFQHATVGPIGDIAQGLERGTKGEPPDALEALQARVESRPITALDGGRIIARDAVGALGLRVHQPPLPQAPLAFVGVDAIGRMGHGEQLHVAGVHAPTPDSRHPGPQVLNPFQAILVQIPVSPGRLEVRAPRPIADHLGRALMARPIWRSRSDPAPDCACAPAAAVRANAPVSTALLTPFMEPLFPPIDLGPCSQLTCHVESTRGVASGSSCPHACIASVQPVTSAPPAPRAVVAARLRQARVLRGLSQREVGVRMGMDKDAASARISRYESEGMSISLEALFELAQALEVPRPISWRPARRWPMRSWLWGAERGSAGTFCRTAGRFG